MHLRLRTSPCRGCVLALGVSDDEAGKRLQADESIESLASCTREFQILLTGSRRLSTSAQGDWAYDHGYSKAVVIIYKAVFCELIHTHEVGEKLIGDAELCLLLKQSATSVYVPYASNLGVITTVVNSVSWSCFMNHGCYRSHFFNWTASVVKYFKDNDVCYRESCKRVAMLTASTLFAVITLT